MKKSLFPFAILFSAVCTFHEASAKRVEKASPLPFVTVIPTADMPEEEPAADLLLQPEGQSSVTIKVFDIAGTLVLQKQVNMQDLFTNATLQQFLPEGSIFVYFSQHTAYYFLDRSSR